MSAAPARQRSGTEEPYLKGKNAAYLWSFVSINLAVFLCLLISRALTESSLDQFWHRVTMKDGIIVVGVPLLTIVLSGVLGDTWKARLVFWRWNNPLPGCRAFSELLASDPRIDVATLRSKLGEFPSDPRAQNALWFKVYRHHSAVLRVLEAHRIYLLTRDMTVIAAVFAVLLSTGISLQSSGLKMGGFYLIALLVQYILVARAARNYGNRFVLNVLSEEASTEARRAASEDRS